MKNPKRKRITHPGILTPDNAETISGNLQDNILALLAFGKDNALYAASVIDFHLFQSPIYREIAKRCIDFIQQHNKAPIHHLPDILEDKLGPESDDAELFSDTLHKLRQVAEGISETFILGELNIFVRIQKMKLAISSAADAVQARDMDSAERALTQALQSRTVLNQGGTRLSDVEKVMDSIHNEVQSYPIQIPNLDSEGIGYSPKTLLTFMAAPNRGKSWALIHFAKAALMRGHRVLHITLELSEAYTIQRYIQTLFAVTTRETKDVRIAHVVFENGAFNFRLRNIGKKVRYMKDPHAEMLIRRRLQRIRNLQLIVKEFPTGQLDMIGLKAYLDYLERFERFVPDVLIIDYADLMAKKKDERRFDLQDIYEGIRGLAVERNLAAITVTQGNRASESAKVLTLANLAEDYAKAAISDTVLAYCQTPQERELQLARIFVAKARTARVGFQFGISQSYQIGQFCLNSFDLQHSGAYWDMLEDMSETSTKE